MRKIPTLAIPLLFVALLLAGCGSSGGTSTPAAGGGRDYGSAATTTAAGGSGPDTAALAERAGLTGTVNVDPEAGNREVTASGTTQEIEIADYYFGPAFIHADPGSNLRVKLTNKGKAPHTFTIDALHIDEVLQPGATATVEVAVPSSGALPFHCRFHQGMGMQGAIFAG